MLTPAKFNDGGIIRDRNYEVALGWRRQQGPEGATWFHHAGVTDGARAIVAIDPARGLAVAILSNASWTADMFGSAVALAKLFEHGPLAPEYPTAPAVDFEGISHPVKFDGCRGVSCAWRSSETGPLNAWLSNGGRGSNFVLGVSFGAAYIASPYGLSWFVGSEGQIGSRDVSLSVQQD